MADIEQERAWLRRHGAEARREDEEATARRYREQDAVWAKTCWYCFHDAHVYEMGGPPGSGAVLHCRAEDCPCGVPPCRTCGTRSVRQDDARPLVLICTGCGAESENVAFA